MGLNYKIKTLFNNVLFNGTVKSVDLSSRRINFSIGNRFASIEFHKMCKGEDENFTLEALSMEQVRGLGFGDGLWTVCSPINKNLPIYTYYLVTEFRTYRVPDVTLGDQEKFVNQINKILKDYEDEQLDLLISESFA